LVGPDAARQRRRGRGARLGWRQREGRGIGGGAVLGKKKKTGDGIGIRQGLDPRTQYEAENDDGLDDAVDRGRKANQKGPRPKEGEEVI
jgi:hypothetical protein